MSPSKRARIWEMYQQNPELSQAKLAEKSKQEFQLDKLTQGTISTVLKEFKVNSAKIRQYYDGAVPSNSSNVAKVPPNDTETALRMGSERVQHAEGFDPACNFQNPE